MEGIILELNKTGLAYLVSGTHPLKQDSSDKHSTISEKHNEASPNN